MKKILIINGPNLNLLGNREDDIYGKDSLDKIKSDCEKKGIEKKLEIIFFQSNNEGEIIDKIHEVNDKFDGLIINPAAYSHTSIAILDALTLFDKPIIEVHISNIHKREVFRHNSYVSQKSTAVIAGFGIDGYKIALEKMIDLCSE